MLHAKAVLSSKTMDTTTNNQMTAPVSAPATSAPAAAPAHGGAPRGDRRSGPRGDNRGGSSRGPRKGPQREQKERVKPEFDSKIITIRRVTRVASGGRRFSFSVAVVAGDRKGRVGVGLGKAVDTSLAIDKATRDAKKNMIKVHLSPQMTLPHAVESKFCSARVMMMPARGRGVVAGSATRTVIELAGIKDVAAKIFSGSKNKINIARATIDALSRITKVPRATWRGKKVVAKA